MYLKYHICTLKDGSLMAPWRLIIFPVPNTEPSPPAVILRHCSIALSLMSLFPPDLTDGADTWRCTT